jgi:hypothetical protein
MIGQGKVMSDFGGSDPHSRHSIANRFGGENKDSAHTFLPRVQNFFIVTRCFLLSDDSIRSRID